MDPNTQTVDDIDTEEDVLIPQDEQTTEEEEETTEPESDQGAMQDQESEDGESTDAEDGESEEEDDEDVVLIDGEAPPQEEEDEQSKTPLAKKLRGEIKERNKENRELRKRLEALEAKKEDEKATAQLKPLGNEPNIDDDGVDYDPAKFKAKWNEWHALKQQHDKAKAEAKNAAQQQQEAWDNRLKEYDTNKSALKVRDFEEVEDVVKQKLNPTQQGIIVHGAENSAVLTYGIGRLAPEKQAELAQIQDPVKFAFAMGKLETQLKVSKRKAARKPERTVKGGAQMESQNSKLARLEAEADRTGNVTELHAERRRIRLAKQNKS